MFRHTNRLQYFTPPEKPDAHLALCLQELLGGHYGEVTVMMQYLLQGWTCKGEAKYRDMLLDIGTEEIGHVEMLSTLIAMLMDKAPMTDKEAMAESNPIMGAIMGGGKNTGEAIVELAALSPEMVIASGGGPMLMDSAGSPWNGKFATASGNLLADFRDNLAKESQGRLQAVRVYNMTDDRGVKDTLGFMIARDTMHQEMWRRAVIELEERFGGTIAPVSFADPADKTQFGTQVWGLSDGTHGGEGAWAQGEMSNGQGGITYLPQPDALGPVPRFAPPDPRLHADQPGAMPASRKHGTA